MSYFRSPIANCGSSVCARLAMVDALVSLCGRKLSRRLPDESSALLRRQVRVTSRSRDRGAPWPPALWHVAAAAAAAVCVFWNSVDGQLVHDDVVAVVNNDDVRPDSPVIDLLRHDFWGGDVGSARSHKSYRPLCVATFRSDALPTRSSQSIALAG